MGRCRSVECRGTAGARVPAHTGRGNRPGGRTPCQDRGLGARTAGRRISPRRRDSWSREGHGGRGRGNAAASPRKRGQCRSPARVRPTPGSDGGMSKRRKRWSIVHEKSSPTIHEPRFSRRACSSALTTPRVPCACWRNSSSRSPLRQRFGWSTPARWWTRSATSRPARSSNTWWRRRPRTTTPATRSRCCWCRRTGSTRRSVQFERLAIHESRRDAAHYYLARIAESQERYADASGFL